MNSYTQRASFGRLAGIGAALALALSLSACNDLLDVTLPAQLTDEVLVDPVGAGIQINTIINTFENEMSGFSWTLSGHEDASEIFLMSPSASSGTTNYPATTDSFNGFSVTRTFAHTLHDKLDKQWTAAQVPQRAQYLAISSLYEGAVYNWMASSLCEGSVDGGPLLSQKQMHDEAERLLTRAITEIGQVSGGDFAMPYSVASSALKMAYGLRAQHRWMAGDLAGAKADAEKVTNGFFAYVTREATTDRRNMPFYAGNESGFAELQRVNDWWKGPSQPANPATGKTWPAVLPFTGYTELGILKADGRAVREDGLPIRRAGLYRAAGEDSVNAVADKRVPFRIGGVQGHGTAYINTKFSSENDDVPLVNWKEMVLIRAEAAGGQGAIDLVNQLRDADGLPRVTYANPNNATQIKYMIIEERRRALFLEGRYYYTKLKNLDLLWFPRKSGVITGGANYQGGVRFALPDNEYLLNSNFGGSYDKRGTGCSAAEKPTF